MVMNVAGRRKKNANKKAQQALKEADSSTQQPLARDIRDPGEKDILLGRGRTSWSHTGNQQFRSFLGLYLKKYVDAKSRSEKTRIVGKVYEEIMQQGGRFLKINKVNNTWYEVGKPIAREKIAHALRDAVGLRIKLTPDSCSESEASGSNSRDRCFSNEGSNSRGRFRDLHVKKQSKNRHSPESSNEGSNSRGRFHDLYGSKPRANGKRSERLFVDDAVVPDESISCEEVRSNPSVMSNPSFKSNPTRMTESSKGSKPLVAVAATTKVDYAKPTTATKLTNEKIAPSPANSSSKVTPVAPTFRDTSANGSLQDDSGDAAFMTLVDSMMTDLTPGIPTHKAERTRYTAPDDDISQGFSAMSLESESVKSNPNTKRQPAAADFNNNTDHLAFRQLGCASKIVEARDRAGKEDVKPRVYRQRAQLAMFHKPDPMFGLNNPSDFGCDDSMDHVSFATGASSMCALSITSNGTDGQSKSSSRCREHRPQELDPFEEASVHSSDTQEEWVQTLRALREQC